MSVLLTCRLLAVHLLRWRGTLKVGQNAIIQWQFLIAENRGRRDAEVRFMVVSKRGVHAHDIARNRESS
jgi:hypothetical protein